MTLPPVVQCFWSDCQFSTKRLGTLVQHMSTHSMERPLACEKCGRGFYSRNKLQNHLVRQYIPYNVPAEDKCKTSPSAVTATPVSDDKHKKREDWVNDVGLPEFQCLVCWKGFATQALLSNHVRRHVSTLKCWHCDYTSSSHYAIDRHVKFRHTSERPFTCDRCSFTAKCENILQRHIHCVHGSAKSVAAVSVKRSSATLLDDVNTPSAAQTRLDQWKTLAPSNVYQDDSTEDNSGTASATSGKSDKRVYQCHLCDKTFSHGYYLSKHAQKFHQLTRAPGFNRFKFQLCADGHYRIQTTRLESSELSQKMIH